MSSLQSQSKKTFGEFVVSARIVCVYMFCHTAACAVAHVPHSSAILDCFRHRRPADSTSDSLQFEWWMMEKKRAFVVHWRLVSPAICRQHESRVLTSQARRTTLRTDQVRQSTRPAFVKKLVLHATSSKKIVYNRESETEKMRCDLGQLVQLLYFHVRGRFQFNVHLHFGTSRVLSWQQLPRAFLM